MFSHNAYGDAANSAAAAASPVGFAGAGGITRCSVLLYLACTWGRMVNIEGQAGKEEGGIRGLGGVQEG